MCHKILIAQPRQGCSACEIMQYAIVLYLHKAYQCTRGDTTHASDGARYFAEFTPVTTRAPVVGSIRCEFGVKTWRIGDCIKEVLYIPARYAQRVVCSSVRKEK